MRGFLRFRMSTLTLVNVNKRERKVRMISGSGAVFTDPPSLGAHTGALRANAVELRVHSKFCS